MSRRPGRRGLAAAALCAFTAAASALEGGVCEQQIHDDVKKRFTQNVTKVEFRWGGAESGLSSSTHAVVTTDGCAGWHYYEIFESESECTRAQAGGRVTNMVRYVSSGDGC